MSNTFKNHKAMKRLMTIGLMLVSAFAFTNCSEQLVSPDKEGNIVDENIENNTPLDEAVRIPYEVFVEEPNTKTISIGNKTYWVDEESALANGLSKDDIDRVTIYSKAQDGSSYINQGKYTYAGNKRFVGNIIENSLDDVNNWYCIYPYTESSASTTSETIQQTLIIGASKGDDGKYTQHQIRAGSMQHISGAECPMFGMIEGSSIDGNPRFTKVKHLSTLLELKVVNQGDSPNNNLTGNRDGGEKNIEINELTFSVPAISDNSANKHQASLPIVGTFIVDLSSASIQDNVVSGVVYNSVPGQSSNTVTLKFDDTISIAPGESASFYLAIRPFNGNAEELEHGDENTTGLILQVGINGITKQVELPNTTSFKAGEKKTLRIPIKLSYPKESNAIGNDNFTVTMPVAPTPLVVNGETVHEAYIIPNGKSVRLSGTVDKLISAIDAGFYASCWQGQRAAMTVSNINLEMPQYDANGNLTNHVQIAYYEPFLTAMKATVLPAVGDILGTEPDKLEWLWSPGFLGFSVKKILQEMLKDGIPREGGMISLSRFMELATITFSSIVENGSNNTDEHILIFDENPVYKEVGKNQINNLLSDKFTIEGNDYTPNFDDLKAAAISGQSNQSIEIIYEKLEDVVGNRTVDVAGAAINVMLIFKGIFNDANHMAQILGDLKVIVDIQTCALPDSTDDKANTYPVILWGIHSAI